ncbi:30S ribosomal protein S6 [Fusobacterium necrophorum BFTR-2]|nr:30S ribosomal protein S6 [Fusobacterium necrophorum BFTR-2]
MKKNICPRCNCKMKQQFIGLLHCKCGISYLKDKRYFERTGDMIFALEKKKISKKIKQVPVIRSKSD